MRTPTPAFIAVEHILWLRADGSETTIAARVGTPYQADTHMWACAAELDGADGRLGDICGGTSMQALSLAIRMLATMLAGMLERGERLVYADDRSPWTAQGLAATFGMLLVHEGRPPETARQQPTG